MREHAKVDFGLLRGSRATAQTRGQSSFEPRNRALDLRPLAVFEPGKPAVHLPAILGFGPASATAFVQMNYCAADAQLLAGVCMIVFGIVTGVGQYAVDLQPTASAVQHRREQGGVLTGAIRDQHLGEQMACIVTGQSQLGPATQLIAFLPGPPSIMRRAMSGLQTRGVDTRFLFDADHSTPGRVLKDRVEQFVKPTFFNRRCCAL